MMNLILSLCIPTNGVTEWVFPVLASIEQQREEHMNFEVIVADNGKNIEFQNQMIDYVKKYPYVVYRKTNAEGFLNQVEAFKLASGALIKFVNHRMPLNQGALSKLIRIAKKYQIEKPVVYFSNGAIGKNGPFLLHSFDAFVRTLGIYSSWSGGIAVWREDFQAMDRDEIYNALYPHITWLFARMHAKQYIIDDTPIMMTLPTDERKKGRYNVFQAFAVEYLAILLDLVRGKHITLETFLFVKQKTGLFLADLYIDYMIRQKACSYSLENYASYLDCFYSSAEFKMMVLQRIIMRGLNKVRKMICRVRRSQNGSKFGN